MAAPAQRIDNLEIPDRPAFALRAQNSRLKRKRVLLYGGIGGAALLILIALLRPGSEDVARIPADAPLIKAEEGPIKVTPESRGGLDVPNRDILVYERLHGAEATQRPIEHLLPDSEQPMTPPSLGETAGSPDARETDTLGSNMPRDTSFLVPPVPEPPAGREMEADKTTQSQKTKLSPSSTSPDTATTQPTVRSQSAAPSQTKVATAPATGSTRTQPEKSSSGNGFQLQLLSSRSVDDAKGAWARLKDKNADLLGPLSPSVARVDLENRGTFYRLRAGPIASETKARSICDSLAARRVSCLVVRSSG